jgi:hypothetical protein
MSTQATLLSGMLKKPDSLVSVAAMESRVAEKAVILALLMLRESVLITLPSTPLARLASDEHKQIIDSSFFIM